LLLIVVGVALVGAGLVRVLMTASGAGLVTVLVIGALLLISPFILTRIERLTQNPSGFELQITRDMTALGAPGTARILEHTDLARLAESYGFIHSQLDGDVYRDARLHLQDLLAQQAAAVARKEKFDAAEVRTLFANQSPTLRVLALGLMKGDPGLADGGTVLAAIAEPQSANEQHQGLELAKLCWPRLPASYRSAIRTVLGANPDIMSGARRSLAQEILTMPDT
jgi:hypothetical protein